MDRLTVLALAASVWFAIHLFISGAALRWWLAARIGEGPFRGLFSLLSALSLGFLVWAYARAPCAPLWIPPRPLLYLPILLMPPALVLFVGAFTVRNPTMAGLESALGNAAPARGALRITRHPFLWAVAIWSGVHALVNGNIASLLFFGSMFLTAVVGTRDIDRKRRRTHPELWKEYEAVTSNVPFAAIASGRNRLVLGELVKPMVVAAVLTGVLVVFHQDLFHVRPVP
jgi:uncharacterized membrane protein